MQNFFAGQMDYVYFFYGLSFIILGGICFSLKNQSAVKLPWLWLGIFGIVHGINEWLDMFSFIFHDTATLSSIRLINLTVSFVCLLKFALDNLTEAKDKGLRRKIYLSLLFLAMLGAIDGKTGLNVTVRYFLGLPSCLGTALVFFYAFKNEDKQFKKPFLSLSIIFGLYALTTGLVVPYEKFPPASWINYTFFLSTTGMPVQFFRGALALLATVMLWFYAQTYYKSTLKTNFPKNYFQISSWLIALLPFIIAIGWMLTDYSSKTIKADIIQKNRQEASTTESYLLDKITKIEQIAKSISGATWIAPALINPEVQENIDHANSVLDRYNKCFNTDVIYLLDSNGTTIASSNRNSPDSFLGKSYKFRSYFQEALSGEAGNYFALGITSNLRGYYSAYPVFDSQNKIIGAVAAKENTNNISLTFRKHDLAFLVDPHGVIFISSLPKYVFNALWPLDKEISSALLASKQFGIQEFKSITPQEIFDSTEINFNNEICYVTRLDIKHKGWSVIVLSPLKQVSLNRLSNIILIFFLCIIVIGLFIALRQRENITAIIESTNEELRKSNQLKSYFVSVASHEIRAPLAIIKEDIAILLDKIAGEMTEKQGKILSSAQFTIDRLIRITTDLLDITKIEAGKMDLKTDFFMLNNLVKKVAASFELKAKEKGLEIKTDLPESNVFLYAEEDKIIEVFTNLINNAMKFTEKGSIEISIREQKNKILCMVSDTGVGISEENLPKVFARFQQFENEVKIAEKGTGLGLSIAKGIVELHQGKIWVASEVGKGTRFAFLLPKYTLTEVLAKEIDNRWTKTRQEKKILALFTIRFNKYAELRKQLSIEKIKKIFQKISFFVENIYKYNHFKVRSGDSEIMLLLPMTKNNAENIKAGLKKLIKETILEESEDLFLDFSYGYSLYPEEANEIQELINKSYNNLTNEREERLKKKILIVDDEPALVKTMELNLFHLGYRNITNAYNGNDALLKVEAEIPDLIILDMKMPDMSGYEVIGRLKEDVKTKDIPILIISGYAVEIDKIRDYVEKKTIPMISKPFNVDQIEKWLKYLL